jgi:hypothetical protein
MSEIDTSLTYKISWTDTKQDPKCVKYTVMDGANKIQDVKILSSELKGYFTVDGSVITVPAK